MSPRNWSLAWKLVAVGLVPALLAIVLGVLRVADQAQTASELGASNRLLEVRAQVADTATALREERDRATLFLAERRLGDRGPLRDAVGGTDATIEQVRTGVAAAGDLDTATRSALEQAEGGFAQLAVLRTSVTGPAPFTTDDVLQRYTAVIERADVLDRALLRQVRTPDVAGLADALTAVTGASEALALQHTVLGAALRTGAVSPGDRSAVGVTDNAFVSALTEYQVALPPTQQPLNFVTSPANAQRDAVKRAILDAPGPGPIPVTPAAWDDAVARTGAVVDQAGTDARTALTAAGDAAEDRSSNLAGVNSVLLMLGLLLAATIVVLVVRALTRSLRVLRTSALDVAQRRLPQAVESMRQGTVPDVTVEPVPLRSRDEVGQVARAFDAVHGQALRLAADQAALQANVSSMFVNLSRRSQALVERQLQLIERLESNEQDPDQLSNLFQLDHLATRMRRNSENLLVLAGTDLAKRNMAPVPLVDVLRAAVSEIEQYQRIVVQAPPQATVVGRATSDIIHLLAELLDNATNFSPPDSQVVMSSMRTVDGSILVEIADRGVGMIEQELGDANRRLGTPMAVDVSASRRMGLVVVGRLATRHGIAVHLGGAPMGGPGGGLTASVTVPAHLITAPGEPVGRFPRAELAPAVTPNGVTPNGVPPQRASQGGRPVARAALAAPVAAPVAAAKQPFGAGNLNGLPLRTPGSSLRRDGRPGSAGPEQAPVEEPVEALDGPSEEQQADGPEADDARSDAERPAAEARVEDRADVEDDAAAAPTGALPLAGSTARAATTNGHPAGVEAEEAAAEEPDDTDGDGTGRDGRGAEVRADTGPDAGADPHGGPRTAVAGLAGAVAGAAVARGAGRADDRDADEAERADSRLTVDGVDARAAREDAVEEDAAREGVQVHAGQDGTGVRPAADTTDTADRADTDQDTDPDTDDAARDTDRDGAAGEPAPEEEDAHAGAPDGTAQDGTGPDGTGPDGTGPDDVAQDGTGGDARRDALTGGTPGGPAGGPRPVPAAPWAPPGPNGTRHDRPPVPAAALPHHEAQRNGRNGTDRTDAGVGPGAGRDGGIAPPTTPLPVVHGPQGPQQPRRPQGPQISPRPTPRPYPAAPAAAAATPPAPPAPPSEPVDAGTGETAAPAEALFSANVPAIAEPEGLPRSRRPLSELRRGPVDLSETTPIFEEIASAWFASDRPVPVDWELGQRPGAQEEQYPAEPPRSPAGLLGRATRTAPAPAPQPAEEFASVADEGWRAADGAAAERPDELTAAGLPKRRPRARLVPGSAGSAVLAATVPPTRSAESIRGRLASYQQGVRQGREIRLRRDPGGAGAQPAATGENAHDEDNG